MKTKESMASKKKSKKATPLFEQEAPVISKKLQDKLDKKELEQDKKFNKDFQKNLDKMNLVEVDHDDPNQEMLRIRIQKLLLEDKAKWHHFSCGKHYYYLKQ